MYFNRIINGRFFKNCFNSNHSDLVAEVGDKIFFEKFYQQFHNHSAAETEKGQNTQTGRSACIETAAARQKDTGKCGRIH
jgi:hypothetical protein